MSTVSKVRPITVEEYLAGEKVGDIRHEFVGGEIFAMVGASEAHNLIAGAFQFALYGHLRGTACRVFAGTMKLRRGDDFYYPDVFVACEHRGDEPHFKARPLLIVEVLSPDSAVRDTREKLAAYQAFDSLREYVLAEQDRREVRVHRRTGGGWDSELYTGAMTVPLASVDLALSMDDICRDVVP